MPTKTEKQIKTRLLNDLKKLKDKKGFIRAGLPRFNGLFGRDSLIIAWQLLKVDPKIARNTLTVLAKYQGKKINNLNEEEPGKILHETYLYKKEKKSLPFPVPYYGSIDSTLWFIIVAWFYYKKTKDKKFIFKIWPNILKAINWIEKYGDLDNDLFLEYKRKNPKALFHQAWKDSLKNTLKITPPAALVEVQGYQYLALKLAKKLALLKKEFSLAKKLGKRANLLKQEFNSKFWLEKEKYFALALDKNKKQIAQITSNPGHLLFTGIIKKEKIKPTVSRLFKKDMFTPYGIRTLSSLDKNFDPFSYHLGSIWPHDNWLIAQGLKKLGYKKEYLKIKKVLLKAYKTFGYIPEFYAVINNKALINPKITPCFLQGWAIGSLINLLS